MSRRSLVACLELCRVSNLPTVWVNVLAAFVVAGAPFSPLRCGLMLLTVSLVYSAGVALNDLCDAAEDAVLKPQRPLPSGRLSRAGAAALIAGLFASAFGTAHGDRRCRGPDCRNCPASVGRPLRPGTPLLAVWRSGDGGLSLHGLCALRLRCCRWSFTATAGAGVGAVLLRAAPVRHCPLGERSKEAGHCRSSRSCCRVYRWWTASCWQRWGSLTSWLRVWPEGPSPLRPSADFPATRSGQPPCSTHINSSSQCYTW